MLVTITDAIGTRARDIARAMPPSAVAIEMNRRLFFEFDIDRRILCYYECTTENATCLIIIKHLNNLVTFYFMRF